MMSEINSVCFYPNGSCIPFSYKIGQKFKKEEIVTKIELNDGIVKVYVKDEAGKIKMNEFHGLSYSLEYL
jgi:hypothetical protein